MNTTGAAGDERGPYRRTARLPLNAWLHKTGGPGAFLVATNNPSPMRTPVPLVLLVLAIPTSFASAQHAPPVRWQRPIGGTDYDFGMAAQPTPDGGALVCGSTSSVDGDVHNAHGLTDGWVMKLNADGTTAWQRMLGGTSTDLINDVRYTSDGGCIVAGLTVSNGGDVSGQHGGSDAWLVKLSSAGRIAWQHTYGGSHADGFNMVRTTPDGGYIAIGHTDSDDGDVDGRLGSSDAWVVKVDADGGLQWQRTLGGTGLDMGSAVQATPDGGYITCGYGDDNGDALVSGHGGFDGWVVKLDAQGTEMWRTVIGGSALDEAVAVEGSSDGGFLAAGVTLSDGGGMPVSHGGTDGWVAKLDPAGNILWHYDIGGTQPEWMSSLAATNDGGCVVGGQARSRDGNVPDNNGGQDAWLVKVSANGTPQWTTALGGSGTDDFACVRPDADGGYVAVGTTTSTDGDVRGFHAGDDPTAGDIWVVRFGAASSLGVADVAAIPFVLAPNPTTGQVWITAPADLADARVVVTDAAGRGVLQERFNGRSSVVDLGGRGSGVYFLSIRSTLGVSTQRVVVQ